MFLEDIIAIFELSAIDLLGEPLSTNASEHAIFRSLECQLKTAN